MCVIHQNNKNSHQTTGLQFWHYLLTRSPQSSHQFPISTSPLLHPLSPLHSLFLTISSLVSDIFMQLQNIASQKGVNKRYTSSLTQQIIFNRSFIPCPRPLFALYYKSSSYCSIGIPWHSHNRSVLKATMTQLAACCFWPGMYRDTKKYIQKCLSYKKIKPITQKSFGLLQPIPTPTKLWDELTTDFITYLPSSYGHTVIWVVYGRLSNQTTSSPFHKLHCH